MEQVVLQVTGLQIGVHHGGKMRLVVDGVDFALHRGEMLALIGESGCGKSLTALAIPGLLPWPACTRLAGSIRLGNDEISNATPEELQGLRGRRIGMIFQEPMTALNPVFTVGDQIAEVLRVHLGMTGKEAWRRAQELLEEVEVPDARRRMEAYPHELSGGLRQRVMIAIALAASPEVLIADEPTTALDVTVQAQIMALLQRLQQKNGTAVLFITHNIALAAQYAHRCAVMYAGAICEFGNAAQLFAAPKHPYTQLLFNAVPRRALRQKGLAVIAGSVPAEWSRLPGCRFAERCPYSQEECRASQPRLRDCAQERMVACHRLEELTSLKHPGNEGPQGVLPGAGNLNHPSPQPQVLRVEGLRVTFPVKGRSLRAVDGVDLQLHAGETLALVGESGCGKSTVGKALLRLVAPADGAIYLDDQQDYAGKRGRALLPLRRHLQMVFQDPFSSLDPRMSVGDSVAEALTLSMPGATAAAKRARVAELLLQVGLKGEDYGRYPHQFSGGQRQRIGLARALAASPRVIVCDECTSALDVSVQAQILNLLRRLQDDLKVAYLFITHDLSVVGYVADRVAVMYLGRLMEEGDAAVLLSRPAHPYTRMLLAASPHHREAIGEVNADASCKERMTAELPSPLNPPSGCPFHPRCPLATSRCAQEEPPWQVIPASQSNHDDLAVVGLHRCRCHFPVLK